jgi:hypothetical protein
MAAIDALLEVELENYQRSYVNPLAFQPITARCELSREC